MGYKTPPERPACSLLATPYLPNHDPDMAFAGQIILPLQGEDFFPPY